MPKLRHTTMTTLAYLIIFLLTATSASFIQERASRRELLHRFDLAASQLDSALNEIENQAIFISELPAVTVAVNQQEYRLTTYLSLSDELDAMNNVSKFQEIRFIHWSSRKVYQANYGIYNLAQLDISSELRRVQNGGFYYAPGEISYYLPLPTSGRQPTALLYLELAPEGIFSYFRGFPVEIVVGDAVYLQSQESHPLDRWIDLDPTAYLPTTWQEGQVKFRLKMPGHVLTSSILKGTAMTVFALGIILGVVWFRMRRARLQLEANRENLIFLLAEGGENLGEQDLASLEERLRESYLSLISKNHEKQVQIDQLRTSRRDLRRSALISPNGDSSLVPIAGLWIEISEEHRNKFKDTLANLLDPDTNEVYEINEHFFVLFYPLQNEDSGEKRAYGLYYGLEGSGFSLRAVLVGAEYIRMPEERLVQRAREMLTLDTTATLVKFKDEVWQGEVQILLDYESRLDTYIRALISDDETEQALDELLELKLSGIKDARSLSEEILSRLRKFDYPFGDRTYPEFITAVLILERQQMMADLDLIESENKLKQIFHSWDERMQTAVRRSEEKSDVMVHVERALELMHQRYREPELSIGEIAEVLALNPIYFGRIFKDVTQQTPSDYLTRLRLQAATKLISEGKESLGTIAEQAGFIDQRSFARFFKKEMGVPPSQWKPPSD